MSRKILLAKSFKKDMSKQILHLASAEWAEVLHCLAEKNHYLPNTYTTLCKVLGAFRDCHVKNDLVLLYKIVDDETVALHYLDTHSEIFKKAK